MLINKLLHKAFITISSLIDEDSKVATKLRENLLYTSSNLEQEVFGVKFKNPVGLAAGFDKNSVGIQLWNSFGFGFAEIGSVTRHPRVTKGVMENIHGSGSFYNKMKLPNVGIDKVVSNIKSRHTYELPIGVNLADVNLDIENFNYMIDRLHGLGDKVAYITINISCPSVNEFELHRVKNLIKNLKSDLPLLVKIPPYPPENIIPIVEFSMENDISGFVATNSLKGFSGKVLTDISLRAVSTIHKMTNGSVPIIGVGGIHDGESAMNMIKCGATLLQIYTGWVNGGLKTIRNINSHLDRELK